MISISATALFLWKYLIIGIDARREAFRFSSQRETKIEFEFIFQNWVSECPDFPELLVHNDWKLICDKISYMTSKRKGKFIKKWQANKKEKKKINYLIFPSAEISRIRGRGAFSGFRRAILRVSFFCLRPCVDSWLANSSCIRRTVLIDIVILWQSMLNYSWFLVIEHCTVNFNVS